MEKGLTLLINHLQSLTSKSQNMSPRVFVDHIRAGVKTEPEKIGELIVAYREILDKFRLDMSSELRARRTLENIATYCVLADHDYETEMMARSVTHGIISVKFYLENANEYGEATKALSKYLRLSGRELMEYAMERDNLKLN